MLGNRTQNLAWVGYVCVIERGKTRNAHRILAGKNIAYIHFEDREPAERTTSR
jgi:hypothetical protein